MGHTGAVWCVDADCILVFAESVLPGSASNGEAADLEVGVWVALVGLENDAACLLGLFIGWGSI